MAGVTQDPEAWARLGVKIREQREKLGMSRRQLSEVAGVSEKAIQVAEDGRTPRARWPQSLQLIESALCWAPGSMRRILEGGEPRLAQVPFEADEGGPRMQGWQLPEASGPIDAPGKPVGFRDLELMQSGYLAQDAFVRQVKRYRKLKGISIEQVAQGVSEVQGSAPPGGALGVAELKRVEAGTRLLKGAEGEAIAHALGTTVEWLLGSSFSSGAPQELKDPPTGEELQAEATAMLQRISEIGVRVNAARGQYAQAKEREAEARRQADWARAIFENASTEQHQLDRQYQYLLGRIDSLRAAKGEELVMQVHPVYEDDGK